MIHALLQNVCVCEREREQKIKRGIGLDERSDLRYSAFKTIEGDTRQGGCVGDMSISTQERFLLEHWLSQEHQLESREH